jgi:hypothetical protein
MPAIASIAAIQSDLSLQRAELKLKLADLVSALAEAKIELTEIQETLSVKDKQIAELEDAFQSKDSLIRHYDAYYLADENGKPAGTAYCLRCWENDHKKHQLVEDAKEHTKRVCTACGHRYSGRMTSDFVLP